MKITTNQAAEILGVTPTTISSLIRKGKLKDHNPEAGKQKKKLLDMAEVKEFKKEFKPNGNSLSKRMINGPLANSVVKEMPSFGSSISERLKRIEDKLDVLIGTWQ